MNDIRYEESQNGHGFCACCGNLQIGEINFLYVGIDRMIIESTDVDEEYKNTNVCLELVRHVVDCARRQHRKIITMCPHAQAMFNRCPEFDDVRFIQVDV